MIRAPVWAKRVHSTLVALSDGTLVLCGGQTTGVLRHEVWVSDSLGTAWTQSGTPPWAARYGHAMVVLADDSVVLMGGKGDSILFNDVWASLDKGQTWLAMPEAASWSPRVFLQAAVLGPSTTFSSAAARSAGDALGIGRIVVCGGKTATTSAQHDVWIDGGDRGATWTVLTASPPWQARWGHALVAFGSHLFLFGGVVEPDLVADTWLWNAVEDVWVELETPPSWSPRKHMGAVTLLDGRVLMFGGQTADDLASDTWVLGSPGASAGVVALNCSMPLPGICRARPFTAPVTVSLPEAAPGVSPPNAASVAATFVVSPPVASITPRSTAADPTLAQFLVSFKPPLPHHTPPRPLLDFTVASTGTETGRTIQPVAGGTDTEWVLEVGVRPLNGGGGGVSGGYCPPGYTSSYGNPLYDDLLCGRVVDGLMNREEAEAACAPFSLATLNSPTAAAFFSELRPRRLDQYW